VNLCMCMYLQTYSFDSLFPKMNAPPPFRYHARRLDRPASWQGGTDGAYRSNGGRGGFSLALLRSSRKVNNEI